MFFKLEKLEKRVRFLEDLRYLDMKEIFPFKAWEDIRSKDEVVKWPPIKGKEFKALKHTFLVGRDKYFWLNKEITVPSSKEGYEVVGVFDMGKTGAGTNSGFESLLYINQENYQAVDSNHKEVFFIKEHCERKVTLDFLLWSGLEGGGEKTDQIMHIQKAELGYLHTITDEFYFLGKAIFKTVKIMEETNPVREMLLTALDKAFLQIDLSEQKEVVYQQIEAAYPKLLEELESIGGKTDVTVHCVGHTHIDVAWLWRLKHTKEKAIRSFSTVMRYLDQYEDYKFAQSQPQLYAYIKENYPEFYEKMQQRVMEGRFEADGGMWVEADCNLSSGEALIRQILEGTKFFEKEFGKRSTCLWLPDVFGYSVALPQILKQCGIKRFVTTKISWNEYNKMPHDTFFWRGLDGSEVMTHFITTPEEGWPVGHMYSTYNGQISPRTVIGTWNKYEDKAVNKDLLISYGYGDGGGGPTRTMIMMRRAMDKVPGIPQVKSTGVKEYLDMVEENLKTTDNYVHTWCGELYLENHRGTYTSQGYNKRMNRTLEYALAKSETLGVFSVLQGGKYLQEKLEHVWRILLLNQFHDIIPGSSIEEVYKDSRIQYNEAFSNLAEVEKEHNQFGFLEKENVYTTANFTLYNRLEHVEIAREEEGIFVDVNGNPLQAQRVYGGYKVLVPLIPMGFTSFCFIEKVNEPNETSFYYKEDSKTLETPFYTVVWDESGKIVSMYDKEFKREIVKEFVNRLTVYEDRPFNNDAWNIDIFHTEKFEEVTNLEEVKVLENGNLEFQIRFQFRYRDSFLSQNIIFYADNRRVDFATNVDWHENHRLLKTCFDVNVMSTEASYDIQFGNVKRPTHFNTSWDYAKFEVAAHKWIDLSETGYGVSLLNNCKYGFSTKDSLMSISLIKCATFPDVAADQGLHEFTYSILPHGGSWQDAMVQEQSEFLNQPTAVWDGMHKESGNSLFQVSVDNLSVDAVKLSEDKKEIILRMHEFKGRRNAFEVTSDWDIKSYALANLLEDITADRQEGSVIQDNITPYQIKTYRITMK